MIIENKKTEGKMKNCKYIKYLYKTCGIAECLINILSEVLLGKKQTLAYIVILVTSFKVIKS